MSIRDNEEELKKALEKAHNEYPHKKMYPFKKENCDHNYNFIVYCDGNYDICRCYKCGDEKVSRCNFDEEYD